MIPGVKITPTHSEEDVKGYIDAGERLLTEAGYDAAERIALMPTMISLLSAKTIVQTSAAGGALDLAGLRDKVHG